MEGRIVHLRHYQTQDPARGSFLVHPLAVKAGHGKEKIKTVPNPDYDPSDPHSGPERLEVFRAAHHIRRKPDGTIAEAIPHPEAIDFVYRG